MIDVSTYDLPAYPADASSVLSQVASDARASGSISRYEAVHLPAQVALFIDAPVDLRFLDLDFAGTVVVGPNGKLVVGHTSQQRPGQRITIATARWESASSQDNVTVEVRGIKQALVQFIGEVSSVAFVADAPAGPMDGSIAYNTVNLGLHRKMLLTGTDSDSWITQNTFIGGDLKYLRVEGDYGHNCNVWYHTCVEASRIEFASGHDNAMYDVRGEAGAVAWFGSRASHNIITDQYVSNPEYPRPAVKVEADLNGSNAVMSNRDAFRHDTTIFAIDRESVIFDESSEMRGAGPVVPGLDLLRVAGNWTWLADTGRFRVDHSSTDDFFEYATRTQLRTFIFDSDARFRIYIELWDSNGDKVGSADGPHPIGLVGGVYSWGSTDGLYVSGSVNTAEIRIHSLDVAEARIRIRNDAANYEFTYLRLRHYATGRNVSAPATELAQRMRSVPAQEYKPKAGLAKVGTQVLSTRSGTRYACVAEGGAVLSAAASDGAATISLTDAAGLAVGDVIGVLLANRLTHWANVASVSGTTVSLSTPLATAAASGAEVRWNRWVE